MEENYPILLNQLNGPKTGIPCNPSPCRCTFNIEKTYNQKWSKPKVRFGDQRQQQQASRVFTHF